MEHATNYNLLHQGQWALSNGELKHDVHCTCVGTVLYFVLVKPHGETYGMFRLFCKTKLNCRKQAQAMSARNMAK